MIDTIIKRDGRKVSFDPQKITDAIMKAFHASNSAKTIKTAEQLTRQVLDELEKNESIGEPSVEEVQDTVERVLIENGFVRTAKSYILYRAERSRIREMNTRLMRIYEDITNKDAIDSDIKRENANINGDTAMGAMLKYGSEGAKQFNLMFVLKPEHAEAHRNGDIHIHDMDFLTLTTTCCQIDLIKLFDGGFSTGHGYLREPNDIASYAALACIAIQANQNDQHGGQSIVNFDYAMAEGVKKTFRKRYRDNLIRAMELKLDMEDAETQGRAILDALQAQGLTPTLEQGDAYREAEAGLLRARGISPEDIEDMQAFAHKKAVSETDRATYQAMEALIHNLNTMNSRAGAQVPFSSINYGMDTSPEARMAIRNLLLSTEAGLGNGETPIFPIQISASRKASTTTPASRTTTCSSWQCAALPSASSPTFPSRMRPSTLNTTRKATGDRDRLHGLPHARDGQCLRPRKTGFQRPRQPQLHHHQPAAPGHQGQPQHRAVL